MQQEGSGLQWPRLAGSGSGPLPNQATQAIKSPAFAGLFHEPGLLGLGLLLLGKQGFQFFLGQRLAE